VFVLNGEELQPVSTGDLIYPGQTLVTDEDGFAQLVFPDHKYTRVSGGARFAITDLVRLVDESLQVEFFLERERVVHSIRQQLRPSEAFRTKILVSVTGVRGTEFRLKMADDAGNIVEMVTGKVSVAAGGEVLAVTAGEGTRVLPGQAPEKPRRLPQPQLVEPVEELYRSLPVVIPTAGQVESVNSLRLTITDDIEGTTPRVETMVKAGAPFVLSLLADGTYYGVITAVDRENFESMPSPPFCFQLRTVPAAPIFSAAPMGDVHFDKSLTLRWMDVTQAEGYTFQLAKDHDFQEILDEGVLSVSEYTAPDLEPGEYFSGFARWQRMVSFLCTHRLHGGRSVACLPWKVWLGVKKRESHCTGRQQWPMPDMMSRSAGTAVFPHSSLISVVLSRTNLICRLLSNLAIIMYGFEQCSPMGGPVRG
jgi:hypothetical protein